ncbi:protein SLOW GREEN 1, chloroplastic-like [Quillaja saponaria]|uniref:Protein SLOW GREEN 1, chloroplastic-like n=1 Tax=Quillaja saponaria TaxID=32244 RepID=A0AAD7PDI9_QUISA|nr:protein SLOW GREEN 1, chloroplastic-like [Quillaja saponaria]
MEALATLHDRHQPLCLSVDFSCPLLQRPFSTFLSLPIKPSSLSTIASSSSSSSSSAKPLHKNSQISEPQLSQFLNPVLQVTSIATVVASSILLFNGFYRSNFTKTPFSLSSMDDVLDEESTIEEFLAHREPHRSIRYYKLKEKIPIVDNLVKTDQAWKLLKTQIMSCSEELEMLRIRFNVILDRDPFCDKAYRGHLLEYLEMVDECMDLLEDIKKAMDHCEKENKAMDYYFKFFNGVVDQIKIFEGDMLGALKYFQELEKE